MKTEQTDSEWVAYLKEVGEYDSYDACCNCYHCHGVAFRFEQWKHEKEHGPTKHSRSGGNNIATA